MNIGQESFIEVEELLCENIEIKPLSLKEKLDMLFGGPVICWDNGIPWPEGLNDTEITLTKNVFYQ